MGVWWGCVGSCGFRAFVALGCKGVDVGVESLGFRSLFTSGLRVESVVTLGLRVSGLGRC